MRADPNAGLAVSGLRDTEGWSTEKAAADFFDVKGTVEGLLANLGDRLTFEASVFPGLHDGQSAAILVDGKPVGRSVQCTRACAKPWVFPQHGCC